jgi:hypothetical protein
LIQKADETIVKIETMYYEGLKEFEGREKKFTNFSENLNDKGNKDGRIKINLL